MLSKRHAKFNILEAQLGSSWSLDNSFLNKLHNKYNT